ncbi:MAG: hypothetical protein WD025_01450 [Bacteriovoracaceae bacterium]
MKFKEKMLDYFKQRSCLNTVNIKEIGHMAMVQIENGEGKQFFLNIDRDSARLLCCESEEIVYVYEQYPPQCGDCLTVVENIIGKY